VTSVRSQQLSRHLSQLVLFGTLALLCVLAVADGAFFLAALLGIGAVFTGVCWTVRETGAESF
jgi:uncharacterized membrane protein HdeD (DUF308 family)